MNRLISSALALALLAAPEASAQVCEEADVQTQLQYLRRLSLDLRGRLPSFDELSSVVTNGEVDPAIVRSMLDSEDFVQRMRAHHRDLLWTNVQDQRLTNAVWLLRTAGRGPAARWYVPTRGPLYRGDVTPCLDEPARFGPEGEILTTPDPRDPDVRREGWVEVTPYWAPDATIRVCAFDAQSSLQGTNPRGGASVDCRRQPALGCGCGPELQWCQALPAGTLQTITASMNEQLLRFVDDVIREDRPYSDVLLAKDLEIDGPLAHWLRHQSQTGGTVLISGPEQNHPLPELAYADRTWTTVERGARHAGVLTMPGFLLKFASNRGRANRFYEAFLCQHFESSEPIPPATDPCHEEPDLTKRCGCKGCHLAVEPAAAYWGRWTEAGLLPMNGDTFPRVNPTCADPRGARSPLCRLFYFTEADVTAPESEAEWVGSLRSYVFADEARAANIEAGPEALARQAVESGAFARCTVDRMWRLFMARPPAPEEAETVEALAQALSEDGLRLRGLVEQLVTRSEYVEAGRFEEVE